MKATELRIGNWISTAMGNAQIRQIDISDSAIKESILQPIPLTEEWLKKFGFEYSSGDWSKQFNENKYSTVDIQFWNHTKEFHFVCNSGDTDCILIYVHQLQNLYFALTNEELKIK